MCRRINRDYKKEMPKKFKTDKNLTVNYIQTCRICAKNAQYFIKMPINNKKCSFCIEKSSFV